MYARLQPATADFQKEVGGDVREVLEAALARHSTLSEGDWLTAEHAGRAFELHVQKLRPARAVSVIGAPVERVGVTILRKIMSCFSLAYICTARSRFGSSNLTKSACAAHAPLRRSCSA